MPFIKCPELGSQIVDQNKGITGIHFTKWNKGLGIQDVDDEAIGTSEDSVVEEETIISYEDCSPPLEPVCVPEANNYGRFPCDQCKTDFSEMNKLR